MKGWCGVLLILLSPIKMEWVSKNGKIINHEKVRASIDDLDKYKLKKKSGLIFPSEISTKRNLSSARQCGDNESYYFEPLKECYRIYNAQLLYVDLDRKIAYGGTRNEYMYNCWQHYRGKLLDIGLEHIGEKMNLIKQMVIDFNRRTFKRQAIQVGFMINRKRELISQNNEHYDVLDNVFVEHYDLEGNNLCPSVCCVVFLADVQADRLRLVDTSCDNRTRALSYICQTSAIIVK